MKIEYSKLAKLLVEFSVNLQNGENIMLDTCEIPEEMVIALIEAVKARGGIPFVKIRTNKISRIINKSFSKSDYEQMCDVQLGEMKNMQAYIAIRGGNNAFEQADIPQEQQNLVSKALHPVIDHRVNKTKWCVLRWPSDGFAQQAKMSTEEFSEFFFRVCTMDYSKMKPGMAALKKRMESTDKVKIVGPGTNLEFSIKGIPAIPCGGSHNIPDGEIFTAPVKTSVNGKILYNAQTVYQGICFDNIELTFKDGKIVNAQAGQKTDKLNAILDSDEGARHIGEFALGFNPHVLHPMCDILFDEKIAGSFHFTPGQAYENADNGNRSQVHWDLVCIQRKEYGGGEMYFDGELVRKDGIFIADDLKSLNPENLM